MISTKGQRIQPLKENPLACCLRRAVLRGCGSRRDRLARRGFRFPPAPPFTNPLRRRLQPPTGIVLGNEPRTGLGNPLSFWLYRPEESNAKNEALQLPHRNGESGILRIRPRTRNPSKRFALFMRGDCITADPFIDARNDSRR